MMLARNVETFLGCDSCYRTEDIVLYGAPFDSTTSFRPGARFGPSAIRHESFGLEMYSPYQNADLTDFDLFDSGDLELCFGSAESALNDIESRAAEILRDNKLPLLLGGEHLVTLGAVRAVLRRFPDLHIVHFDAHADLRQHYLGAQLSHACVLRRCHDLLGDGRIHQFCIRSGERGSLPLPPPTPICTPLTLTACPRWRTGCVKPTCRCILPSTWTAWTPGCSPAPERRRPGA